MKFGVGQPAPRVEDLRLLRGLGRYTDDIDAPRQARAYFVRSPYASARIRGMDTSAARAAPGVLAVLTGADVVADGLGPIPCMVPRLRPQHRPDGSPMFIPPRIAIADEEVAFVGDIVAMVIAETLLQARDAAELVEVDYEERPANTALALARAPQTPPVWADCPDNVSFVLELGDRAAVDATFASAAHVVELEIPYTRIAQNPMEPRAAVGEYDRREDRYVLTSGNQMPHNLRLLLAEDVFRIPESRIRVVSPDMGGAFGMRSNVFPELVAVLWAARRLGRPVKWTADRSESFLSDDHGRDAIYEVGLALDADGDFLAVRAENTCNLGAYCGTFGPFPIIGNLGGLAGVYRTPAIAVRAWGVYTNTTPVGPYRGAGRPEATMAIELLIDKAADVLGVDRLELRRRNLIPPEAMPFQTGLTYKYDSGEFARIMDLALEKADVAGFEARREASRASGKLRGLGIINAIEQSAGLFDEAADIRMDSHGFATVTMGTHSHGQGHETVFRQIVSERLGLDFEQIRYVQGDTDAVAYGHGTGGSRVSGLGGAALAAASDALVEKGRLVAAHRLEAAASDIEFEAGEFRVAGTDRRIALAEVARVANSPIERPAGTEAAFRASGTFVPGGPTFPNGCHVSEVEIDPETGVTRLVRYTVVNDVGTVLNPLLLRGQVHGGVVQGAGQILMEKMQWDESGQLVTGSLMDYCLPRADDMPSFEVGVHEVPSPTNPLGVKGAGESGSVGAMPCVTSAILDALKQAGVERFDMPASPMRVWAALRAAR